MARKPRKKSLSGIYHVMLRGINKQTIFEDKNDRYRFMQTLAYVKKKSDLLLYGYCLMDNHVHLLIEEREESISKVIQRLSSSYVLWYNRKYDRTGHLFQGRFRSETIESVRSFLKVLRYIHQNPVQAGLASDAITSKWTSMQEYLGKPSLVDTEVAVQLFALDREKAIRLFIEFMLLQHEDEFMNNTGKKVLEDAEVMNFLTEIGISNISHLQKMGKSERDAVIRELKALKGITIRQLSRITGIPKSVIARVK